MLGDVEESVGIEHLVDCLADGTSMAGDGVLRCYVGFEPSGKAHIGWKVLSLQLKRMLEADTNVLIFLADWHAWVNDKFGGNMEDIQKTAVYMEETFRALLDYPEEGDGPGQLRFYWASQLMDSGDSIYSVKNIKEKDKLLVQFYDGKISAEVDSLNYDRI